MDLAIRSRSDSEASLKPIGEANPWASKYRTGGGVEAALLEGLFHGQGKLTAATGFSVLLDNTRA